MIKMAITICAALGIAFAYGQTIQPGSSSLNSGSTPFNCATSGGVAFNNAGILGCNGALIINSATSSSLGFTSVGGAAISANVPQLTFTPNSGNAVSLGMGNTGGALGVFSPNVPTIAFSTNINLSANSVLNFTNASNNPFTTTDTGISRHATAGVLDIGNGTAQSTAGGIQTGNATLLSLTTGTNADFLCLNSGGGILIQNAACTISSLRFKPDWKPYTDNALTKVGKMDVGTFHLQTGPNADPNAASLQAGLSAESIAAIAPECAIYENDMKTPKSYRQECVIALLVKAIQQLKIKK